MARPIAAFAADLHLRPVTWTKHPELKHDAYESLDYIITYCIREQLPLILAGDLFDKVRPDSLSVDRYMKAMDRMQQASLRVYAVDGNHDRATPSWAQLHGWVIMLGADNISGIEFAGIDWQPKDKLQDAINNLFTEVSPLVLVMHQSWDEIQGVGITEGSFDMLPTSITLITGDYHVTTTCEGKAADGGRVVAYSPGSTCMQALNEDPRKSFGVIHSDLSVTWESIDTRPYFYKELQNEQQLVDFVTGTELGGLDTPYNPVIQKPILRVKFVDEIPDAHQRLTQTFSDRCHLFLEPQRQQITEVIDEAVTREGAFDSLISAVGELVTKDSPIHNGTCRLLQAPEPKAEITTMFEEFKVNYAQTQNDSGVPVNDLEKGQT